MSTPDLQPWQADIAGLRIGPGTAYGWPKGTPPTGLTERPAVRDQDEDNPSGDGDYLGTDTLSARIITMRLDVDGRRHPGGLPGALAALEVACAPKRDVDFWARLPTWATPRRCSVRVRRYDTPTDLGLRRGTTHADVQLKAADPVLYGPEDADLTTGFPVQVGGLQFPLYTDGAGTDLGYLDYGAAPETGRLLLTNAGTADIAPVFEVVGPVLAEGFAIVRTDTGQQIVFSGPLAAGAHLVIDAADGSALIDGTADRGGQLTYRQFWTIGAGELIEIAFLPLGSWSAARLTVHAPSGWW